MAIPELEQVRVTRALRSFCDKVPSEIRDRLTHDFRIAGSDVELFERRPHYRERERYVEHIVAKFRYTSTHRSWTLFWADRNGRWHRYENFVDRRNFLDLLQEVEKDPTGIFWG